MYMYMNMCLFQIKVFQLYEAELQIPLLHSPIKSFAPVCDTLLDLSVPGNASNSIHSNQPSNACRGNSTVLLPVNESHMSLGNRETQRSDQSDARLVSGGNQGKPAVNVFGSQGDTSVVKTPTERVAQPPAAAGVAMQTKPFQPNIQMALD